jgi:branched-chain amino acid transport system ATP-binding protein
VTTNDVALCVQGLSAGYLGVPVVRDLDITVRRGEVVALMGPNGAGKTTTLLTVSGLLSPIRGTVEVLGKPCNTGRPWMMARRGLAHVSEDRGLFYELNVAENLRLASKSAAMRRKAVEYFPALEKLMSRRAGLLSGGEQQMLALARAVAASPAFLMVDEMSLGLAPVIVERFLPVLRRIADETNAAVLIVEQHVHLAIAVADRGYVLSHGDLVDAGTAFELGHRRALLESSYLGESVLDREVTPHSEDLASGTKP